MNYALRTNNSAYQGDRAVIYCRLSKDDEHEVESASIEHQRDLLTSYCLENGFSIVGIYQDDGFTGTNQNRPGFQALLKMCGDKKVDVVVTKDLSRLGRILDASNTLRMQKISQTLYWSVKGFHRVL